MDASWVPQGADFVGFFIDAVAVFGRGRGDRDFRLDFDEAVLDALGSLLWGIETLRDEADRALIAGTRI
jgi:hypothetical protein